MKNIIKYLNLNDIGGLEFVFALTPILMGFSIGGIPLSLLMWLILIIMVLLNGSHFKLKNFKPLTVFIVYLVLHQLFLFFIADVNLNSIIAQLLYFASVFFLYPSLSPIKLRGAMNWVAILSIIGLLCQWSEIMRGGFVHPLEIPGLEMSVDRMETMSFRPSSFYMEPAAYVSFMVCPLAFSLIDKKYIWSVAIILTIFLTTSTTGILLSFIMLAVSLAANKARISSGIIVVAIGLGLFYILNNSELFGAGIEKIENTEASTNVRLSQGPNVVNSMRSSEIIFGVPYSSAYDYCKAGHFTDVVYYGESVYMATFWNMILLYGLVGLILYLHVYWKLFRMSRLIWPILIGVCVTLFSDPDFIYGSYVYKLIFMLVIASNDSNIKEKISHKSARRIMYN